MVRLSMAPVILALWAGCAGKGGPETPKDEAPKDAVTDQAPAPAPESEPAPVPTSAELYAECQTRVEGPQKDDECKVDADCAKAGCGQEVCTTAAEAANITTTCEDKLCFKILDTCGCHEGECTWTLKPEVPASQIPVPGPAGSLPSSLPPTTDGGEENKDAPAPEPAPDAPKDEKDEKAEQPKP